MATPTGPETTEWHYVITIQIRGGDMATASGVVQVEPHGTRNDVYQHVYRQVTQQAGSGGAVIFYTADPNHP